MARLRRLHRLGLAVLIGTVAASAAAHAASSIGEARTVKNEVEGKLGAQLSTVAAGDAVSQSEIVRTGSESTTLLRFRDDTNLTIGPQSTVVLDKFVYNPDGSAKDVALDMTKGAFRFVTGNSAAKNFAIKTPVMTLGIRGTQFMVVLEDGRSGVFVETGEVRVCPFFRFRSSRLRCEDPRAYLLNPASGFNAMFVSRTGTSGPVSVPPGTLAGLAAAIASGQATTLASLSAQSSTTANSGQTQGSTASTGTAPASVESDLSGTGQSGLGPASAGGGGSFTAPGTGGTLVSPN